MGLGAKSAGHTRALGGGPTNSSKTERKNSKDETKTRHRLTFVLRHAFLGGTPLWFLCPPAYPTTHVRVLRVQPWMMMDETNFCRHRCHHHCTSCFGRVTKFRLPMSSY